MTSEVPSHYVSISSKTLEKVHQIKFLAYSFSPNGQDREKVMLPVDNPVTAFVQLSNILSLQ